MRTVGGLHARMIERENLLQAVHRAAKGRRAQPAVVAYLERLDEELDALREQLATVQPRCGECQTFTIYDPKQRLVVTLGDRPQAGTACCAAAVGSTTAGTPDPPTATATTRRTATTTSASAPAPAPADCRSALVEQVRHPAPSPPAMDETPTTRCWPVAPMRPTAPSQGEQRVFFFVQP